MTTPGEPDPRDLAAAYVLGALSPAEARAFEAVLAVSAEARQDLAELRETAALLALTSREAHPSPTLRARVLDAVAAAKLRPLPTPAGAALPSRPRTTPLLWGALAASVAAVVALGLQSRSLTRALAERAAQVTERDSTIARQTRALTDQSRQLAVRDSTLASLLAPGVQLVQLTASGDPDPQIQLFWDRRRSTAVLHASHLRPVPPGRTYQLWFIQDGKPVPSVTFDVAPTGDALVSQVSVPAGGAVSAAAVTEEPAGGSPQPTTPILLVGALPKT